MTDVITSISLDDALAKAGPAAASFARLWASLWKQDHVPVELLELCRLTFARLHQSGAEMAATNPLLVSPVTAGRRAAVLAGAALDDPAFSPKDKAILLFAEYYWVDPQSITDEVADAVKTHVGEAGFVFLIEALGCIDGRIRAARCLSDMAVYVPAKEVAYVG
ncbi:hypothetical protein ACFB49_34180 [Sphingomonas sp. DBB INV C78]|uniref:hypothetical protein n=1 Tax=Sphingomonas sp. DBB INV C78 TaxID=3349434 RepID=UPI0036D3FB67